MRKCWEMLPRKRPTFEELHSNISKYIEHIAGYLQMEFNPFSGVSGGQGTGQSREQVGSNTGEGYGVEVMVTPPSVPANGAHSTFKY